MGRVRKWEPPLGAIVGRPVCLIHTWQETKPNFLSLEGLK
jgi:hypothetical protein